MSDKLYSLFVKRQEYTTFLCIFHIFCHTVQCINKNTNTIPVNPISKTIVSVPARNDIIPKYSVHDKNNIDIMICRILYPSFNDIMYFGSSSANILDFFSDPFISSSLLIKYRIYSISSLGCFFDTLHSIRTNDGIAPNNKSIPQNDN